MSRLDLTLTGFCADVAFCEPCSAFACLALGVGDTVAQSMHGEDNCNL